MSKVCLNCAARNRFTFTPCKTHDTAQDPATCSHELTSYVFTENGLNDSFKCHACGIMLEAAKHA